MWQTTKPSHQPPASDETKNFCSPKRNRSGGWGWGAALSPKGCVGGRQSPATSQRRQASERRDVFAVTVCLAPCARLGPGRGGRSSVLTRVPAYDGVGWRGGPDLPVVLCIHAQLDGTKVGGQASRRSRINRILQNSSPHNTLPHWARDWRALALTQKKENNL